MSGASGGRRRRQYQSPVRDEGARQTRQAILAAARELFVAQGYAATSLAEIAGAADVARPTVFAAFGSKPAILRQLLDRTYDALVLQRDWPERAFGRWLADTMRNALLPT
jgi:AcrR family transcriptional regulator